MRIAFVYIAEAYQCYHVAAVAIELAALPGITVDSFYNDPETPYHLDRITEALGADPLPAQSLQRGPLAQLIQGMRIFGLAKNAVMRANRAELMGYDIIVAAEETVFYLIEDRSDRPLFVYIPHGAGDRKVGMKPSIRAFDLVLPSGNKTARRFLAENLVRPGRYAVPGYIKLETAGRLREARPSLFANDRPTILYNPHKARGLESWSRFIEPMLAQFAVQQDFNLIVAPHVKMFRRRSRKLREGWRARSSPNILIDPGSDRSVDNSYTVAADIYVGDVSSQVYEFLAEPRPCVFLNAHRLAWRGDPNFRHWQLGEVIDDPAELMPAIRRAPALHHQYRPMQQALAEETLGDPTPGAARRAADAILEYARQGAISAAPAPAPEVEERFARTG